MLLLREEPKRSAMYFVIKTYDMWRCFYAKPEPEHLKITFKLYLLGP